MSSKMAPSDLIVMLNQIVQAFDNLTDKYYIDKVKTIGDAYFCVAGAHASKSSDHAERMLKFSIDVFSFLNHFNKGQDKKVNLRIGIHTGDAVGGVIGTRKFAYDLWGVSYQFILIRLWVYKGYHQYCFKNGIHKYCRKNSNLQNNL